jgi:outer membrane protein TolC
MRLISLLLIGICLLTGTGFGAGNELTFRSPPTLTAAAAPAAATDSPSLAQLPGWQAPPYVQESASIETFEQFRQQLLTSAPEIQLAVWNIRQNAADMAGEALDNGWDFTTGMTARDLNGTRTDLRDTSGGRTVRELNGPLEENRYAMEFGLEKPLLGSLQNQQVRLARMQVDHALLFRELYKAERDSWEEAAIALAQLVASGDALPLAQQRQQVLQAVEALRSQQAQQGEALHAQALEAQAQTAGARTAIATLQAAARTAVEVLSRLLNTPDFSVSPALYDQLRALALITDWSDNLPQRREITDTQQLVPMLDATSRQVGQPLPELDLAMGVKLEDYDRYFYDTQRMDQTAEWSIGAGFTIPLSLRGIAQARRQRMEALARSLDVDVQVLQQKYSEDAAKLAEDLAVALAKHQQAVSEQQAQAEIWRVARRQVDQLPNLLKGDPQVEVLRCQAAWLDACEDVVDASAQVISCQLQAAGLREEFDIPGAAPATQFQNRQPGRQEGSQQ